MNVNDPQNDALQKVACPECDTPLNMPKALRIGKIIECHACATESEVIILSPLKLAPLEEEK